MLKRCALVVCCLHLHKVHWLPTSNSFPFSQVVYRHLPYHHSTPFGRIVNYLEGVITGHSHFLAHRCGTVAVIVSAVIELCSQSLLVRGIALSAKCGWTVNGWRHRSCKKTSVAKPVTFKRL